MRHTVVITPINMFVSLQIKTSYSKTTRVTSVRAHTMLPSGCVCADEIENKTGWCAINDNIRRVEWNDRVT